MFNIRYKKYVMNNNVHKDYYKNRLDSIRKRKKENMSLKLNSGF